MRSRAMDVCCLVVQLLVSAAYSWPKSTYSSHFGYRKMMFRSLPCLIWSKKLYLSLTLYQSALVIYLGSVWISALETIHFVLLWSWEQALEDTHESLELHHFLLSDLKDIWPLWTSSVGNTEKKFCFHGSVTKPGCCSWFPKHRFIFYSHQNAHFLILLFTQLVHHTIEIYV